MRLALLPDTSYKLLDTFRGRRALTMSVYAERPIFTCMDPILLVYEPNQISLLLGRICHFDRDLFSHSFIKVELEFWFITEISQLLKMVNRIDRGLFHIFQCTVIQNLEFALEGKSVYKNPKISFKGQRGDRKNIALMFNMLN